MNSFLPFPEVLLLSFIQELTFVLVPVCHWIWNRKSKTYEFLVFVKIILKIMRSWILKNAVVRRLFPLV